MTRILMVGVLLALCGCQASEQTGGSAAPAQSDVPAQTPEPPAIVRERGDVPARYVSEWPNTVVAMRAWLGGDQAYPPIASVADLIMLGDAESWQALERTAAKVAAAEASAWAALWNDALGFREAKPAFCDRARAAMQGDDSTLRKTIASPFAAVCARSEDRDLIGRAETPDWAVLAYYISPMVEDRQSRRYMPRLEDAARAMIASGDAQEQRKAAFALASLQDPRANAALLRIHQGLKDPARADAMAVAFFQTADGEGRAIAEAACARHSDNPMCSPGARMPLPNTAPSAEPAIPSDAIRARLEQLQAAGFTRVSALDPAALDSDAADQILVEAGSAYWFDVETGTYPNEHDGLMRELAQLVSPALDRAVFEEDAPGMDDEESPYTLRIYAGGWVYTTKAENLGDWYDVDAVLRLMNGVLADQGAQERLVVLATEDQTATIVGAPQAVLKQAFERKLLQSGEADAAEALGKDYETKVIEQMRKASGGI